MRNFILVCQGEFIICSLVWRGPVLAGKKLCYAKPGVQWALSQAATVFFLQTILMVMTHLISCKTLLNLSMLLSKVVRPYCSMYAFFVPQYVMFIF